MEIIIKPKNQWWHIDLQELWRFRDLFYFLTWRDVKVKYKQTSIGILWALFQPIITMVVFTVFFGRLAHIQSDGVPYSIFVYSGLIFWGLFSSSLSAASNSFIENEKIVTKIYFPRLILPISAILTSLVDFLIATLILFALMFWYGYAPSLLAIFWLPVLTAMTILTTMGIGLLFSSLNVKYRDIRYVLPFFIQLLLFVTPVIYPVSIVSAHWRPLLGLNPMAGVIDTARAVFLHTQSVNYVLLSVSVLALLAYCLIGFFYFKKTERYFADVI